MTPAERFSGRVADYVRARPSYPQEVFDALERECGPLKGRAVADVGAGTGISSAPLLERGAIVYAVEPNDRMRAAAVEALGRHARFHAVRGFAEATTLADRCADIVLAAQAFHWFRIDPARREFQRILRPEGWIAILWNDRETDTTPFLQEYEAFLHQWSVDYAEVSHRRIRDQDIERFCAPRAVRLFCFRHSQQFGWDGLVRRHDSSSYSIPQGDPRYEDSQAALRDIYLRHACQGRVTFEYTARLYLAGLKSGAG